MCIIAIKKVSYRNETFFVWTFLQLVTFWHFVFRDIFN